MGTEDDSRTYHDSFQVVRNFVIVVINSSNSIPIR